MSDAALVQRLREQVVAPFQSSTVWEPWPVAWSEPDALGERWSMDPDGRPRPAARLGSLWIPPHCEVRVVCRALNAHEGASFRGPAFVRSVAASHEWVSLLAAHVAAAPPDDASAARARVVAAHARRLTTTGGASARVGVRSAAGSVAALLAPPPLRPAAAADPESRAMRTARARAAAARTGETGSGAPLQLARTDLESAARPGQVLDVLVAPARVGNVTWSSFTLQAALDRSRPRTANGAALVFPVAPGLAPGLVLTLDVLRAVERACVQKGAARPRECDALVGLI